MYGLTTHPHRGRDKSGPYGLAIGRDKSGPYISIFCEFDFFFGGLGIE